MKNQWMVYAIVAGISVLAGVAIAGTPNSVRSGATIVAPATTAPPPAVTVAAEPQDTAAPVETAPEPVATSAPVETAPPTTVAPETTTTIEPPPKREDIAVVAINGAGTGGVAGRARDELTDLGYSEARATDGTTVVDTTTVYYFEGFEQEAEEVALDLDLDPFRNKPVAEAPDFGQLDGDQVAVYIGRDRS